MWDNIIINLNTGEKDHQYRERRNEGSTQRGFFYSTILLFVVQKQNILLKKT